MNGPHDLGGMQSFGTIDPEPEDREPVFHAEWERRVFGLTLAAGFLGKWTIDQSRYARERQHPIDYLRHSYYEGWLVGLETLLLETGLLDEEELRRGRAVQRFDETDAVRPLRPDDVAQVMATGSPVSLDLAIEPRFSSGDRVRVRNRNPIGHTRAPRYARGRLGSVHVDHGVHVFADKRAHGVREGQHLYSVRFTARELWGAETSTRDSVYLDLWDDHLEPG